MRPGSRQTDMGNGFIQSDGRNNECRKKTGKMVEGSGDVITAIVYVSQSGDAIIGYTLEVWTAIFGQGQNAAPGIRTRAARRRRERLVKKNDAAGKKKGASHKPFSERIAPVVFLAPAVVMLLCISIIPIG